VRKVLCAYVLAIAQPVLVSAQIDRAAIRVEVRSAGEPVAGATILAGGTTIVTGPDGTASVLVSPGAVEITVTKDGYLPAVSALTVRAGERRSLEIELRTVFATLGVTAEDRGGGTLPLHTAPDGRPFRESLDTQHAAGGLAGSWLTPGGRVPSVRVSALTQGQQRQSGDVIEYGSHTRENVARPCRMRDLVELPL